MSQGVSKNIRSLRTLPVVAVCVAFMCVLAACEEEKHTYVANVDISRTPTMVTVDVKTLISDSGYTRYNIVTPLWEMYDEVDTPYWRFPMGLELEQFDKAMRPDANIRCDSAVYFSQQRLWRLDGNVVMVNTARDSFLTQQLFWDQLKSKIYSDSFIHIVKQNHIIEGYGFESNQNMTAYSVNRPTAIIPVDQAMQKNREHNEAEMNTDSINAVEATTDRPAAPVPASRRNAFTIL